MVLLFELKYFWPSICEEGGYFTRTNRRMYAPKWDVDIYIPELQIAIEYDSAYFHKANSKRKTDKEKTIDVESQGITVIHVLESPLQPINKKNDIPFIKFDGKIISNLILDRIVKLKRGLIHKTILKKIDAYISQNDLCNEIAREEFRENFTAKVMHEREKRKYLNKINYLDFEQARKFARSFSFKNQAEWKKYAAGQISFLPKKPKEIPSDPYSLYKGKGWINWKDWIGKKEKTWRNFEDSKAFIHTLKLKNTMEWRQYIYGMMKNTKPDDIPNCPDKVYKRKGWKNMKDWLGTSKET